MAVRSVRYGGGVWRQMEEKRVALEQRLATVSDELEERSRQVQDVSIARDVAVRRVVELERRLDEQERRAVEVERALSDEKLRAQDLESEVLSWRAKSEGLEAAKSEAEAAVETQREALHIQGEELERSQLQVVEVERELQWLTDLLYVAQERAELLEQRGVEQDRALRVAQGSALAKTRQISGLTRDKHELARKLADLRGGGGGCRLATSNENSPVQPSATRTEARPVEVATKRLSVEPGALALEAAPLARMLRRTRERLAQEQQRNTELEDRVKQLKLDRRALVQRFREASAARRRVQQSASSCA